jgi:hypothetical protein
LVVIKLIAAQVVNNDNQTTRKEKEMKRTPLVFALVISLFTFVMVLNANAIIVKIPHGPCTETNASQFCVGGYNLTDMGQFDAQGNWTWDAQFIETMMHANFDVVPTAPNLVGLGPNWLNIITPQIVTTPPKITSGRLDRRYYSPDNNLTSPEIRIAFQASSGGASTSHVALYLRECFKMREDGIEISVACGDHGTPVDPGVTRVSIFAENETNDMSVIIPRRVPFNPLPGGGIPYTMADIESVKWIERNLVASPFITDIQKYSPISYDLTKRFWKSAPGFVNAIDLQYNWTPIPPVEENETATFEIKLKNIDTPLYANTIIKSVDSLPIILSTYKSTEYNILKDSDKKSGKMVIKAEEVEVTRNNITVRETDDPAGGKALVIQWPEPDLALFGGVDMPPNSEYQVKVWVGASKQVDMDFTEAFLFYDIPAQMGTCVVEGPSYDTLLSKFTLEGVAPSDLRVRLFYRQVYNTSGMPSIPGKYPIQYQNRTMSALVPINEN